MDTMITDYDDTQLDIDESAANALRERHDLVEWNYDDWYFAHFTKCGMVLEFQASHAAVVALAIDVYKVLVRKAFPDAYCKPMKVTNHDGQWVDGFLIYRPDHQYPIGFHAPTELQAWHSAHAIRVAITKEKEND